MHLADLKNVNVERAGHVCAVCGTGPLRCQRISMREMVPALRCPTVPLVYAIRRLQVHPSGTWCWSVAFTRAGKRYGRRFYDPQHGGSRAARRAAIAWRDEQLAQVQPLRIVEFAALPRSNNTSGVPGVSFLKPARQPEGIWQARLKLGGGRTRTASFSVRLHGYEGALALAVKARQAMLASGDDRAFIHAPTAKRAAAMRRP